MNIHEKRLKDIVIASTYHWSVSKEELFALLQIDSQKISDDELMELLLTITTNMDVQLFDNDTKLAIVKAAQELLGSMFMRTLKFDE